MKAQAPKPPTLVLTVGHSTRALDEFIEILKAHGVKLLVDVRTVPRSRHNPQFNKESLPKPLAKVGIRYEHMPGLGGLRHPRRDSPNMGWRNASFRGYADYMQTKEFESNLGKLIKEAQKTRLAVMCAEAVPWRCHRSLIADALVARRAKVEHILSAKSTKEHSLTPWARVRGTKIIYPPETLTLDFQSAQEPA